MEAPSEVCNEIENCDVAADEAVKVNEKLEPPLNEVSKATPEPPVPYVGRKKSVDGAVVGTLKRSRIVTVQEMTSLRRMLVVNPVAWPTQLSTENVDGEPITAKETEPVIKALEASLSVM